jgi:hypothetical protein
VTRSVEDLLQRRIREQMDRIEMLEHCLAVLTKRLGGRQVITPDDDDHMPGQLTIREELHAVVLRVD